MNWAERRLMTKVLEMLGNVGRRKFTRENSKIRKKNRVPNNYKMNIERRAPPKKKEKEENERVLSR